MVINPHAENPPWSGLDLFIVTLVLLASLFLFSTVFFFAVQRGPLSRGAQAVELSKNPGPLVIVPSMSLGYAAMLAAMYWLVTRYRRRPFWQAVGWRWPGSWWFGYVAGGTLLALGLGVLSRLLPIPKSLPMDKFFQNEQGAYLMLFFGVAIAPLAEELLFRGFLYPVLDRWLGTLFMTPPQIRRSAIGLLIAAVWGYTQHWLTLPWSILLSLAVMLVGGTTIMARSLKPGTRAPGMILPGGALLTWGVVASSLSLRAFDAATAALVALASLLGFLSLAPAAEAARAGHRGRFLAILITSGGFALVHSEQLGQAWGPLLVLFVVGLVLTVTRVVTRSLTPGYLMHIGYNLTLFTLLYLGTDRFRHLERMTQQ